MEFPEGSLDLRLKNVTQFVRVNSSVSPVGLTMTLGRETEDPTCTPVLRDWKDGQVLFEAGIYKDLLMAA